ncbi:MAG: hypothetical protein Q4D85_05085 [Corynebacterium sp.]|uniref:hypothetical protein n=1 Tax=Corynebacterium sp. TaxID=1720 RepID=UPI0026DB1718|nr:hypothetical protein [Corynebacterium sp.]MDO5098115.1 hypothetical protein [Corynebacterium sp.]
MRFVIAVVVALSLVRAPYALAVNPINQGDPIYLGNSVCTAGFIDRENNRIWTAGHCHDHGATVTNRWRQKVGTLVYRWSDVESNLNKGLTGAELNEAIFRFFPYDLAYVELSNPAAAGQNGFSGDRVYRPEVGDTMCRWGDTTKQITCGPVLKLDSQLIYGGNLSSKPGDSGGPTWVPGKGYIGQTLGIRSAKLYDGTVAASALVHRHDVALKLEKTGVTPDFPEIDDILANPPKYYSDKLATFGAELPTSAEMSRLLKEHEAKEQKLTEKLDRSTANLSKANERRARAAAELEQAQADAVRLAGEEGNLRTEISELTGKISDSYSELVRLNDELAKNNKPRETGELFDEHQSEYDATVLRNRNRNAELQAAIDKQQEELQKLGTELDSIDGLHDAIARLKREIAEAREIEAQQTLRLKELETTTTTPPPPPPAAMNTGKIFAVVLAIIAAIGGAVAMFFRR